MSITLTNRLRIGFAVLIFLITAVSIAGVGRLFQIREDFEDDSAHYANLALQNERMRSTFVLEQSALGGAAARHKRRVDFARASAAADAALADAHETSAGDPLVSPAVDKRIAAEAAWRSRVAKPIVAGGSPLRRSTAR